MIRDWHDHYPPGFLATGDSSVAIVLHHEFPARFHTRGNSPITANLDVPDVHARSLAVRRFSLVHVLTSVRGRTEPIDLAATGNTRDHQVRRSLSNLQQHRDRTRFRGLLVSGLSRAVRDSVSRCTPKREMREREKEREREDAVKSGEVATSRTGIRGRQRRRR